MKKLLIIVIILGLYSTAQAQFLKNIGIKIGGTVSQQKHEYNYTGTFRNYDPDSKTGFNVGIFGEVLSTPVFSLIGEINYVEKGFQEKLYFAQPQNPNGEGTSTLRKMNLNYLNFSALAKVRLQSSIFTPYVLFGPKVDIELNKSCNYSYEPEMSDFKKIRFGFKAGIGTGVLLFGINFLAEVMYDKDLGYLYETKTLRISTSAIDFRAGVSIGL